MSLANTGHTIGYGDDIYTKQAISLFRQHLGEQVEPFFVFTGTAANVLGITAVTRSWNSVITAFTAHIEQDECGAPEKFSGCKLLTVDTPDGKLTPSLIGRHMHGFDFEHHSQPKVISISQATEMGTVYKPDEIRTLANFAHEHGMLLHMDGARIANAAVALNLPFRSFITDAGVDILSFGGTKNGMMVGEAICFLKPELAKEFKYLRKQGMQLASKMRFISAQFIGWFKNDLWHQLASQSNAMAKLLAKEIRGVKGIVITQPVEANGIFVIIPHKVAQELRSHYFFYPWNEETSEYRWMTSWDTTDQSSFFCSFSDQVALFDSLSLSLFNLVSDSDSDSDSVSVSVSVSVSDLNSDSDSDLYQWVLPITSSRNQLSYYHGIISELSP
jgi:threonine aldolase